MWLLSVSPHERLMLLPTLIIAHTALLFWITLRNRGRDVPLFEIGVIYMVACASYTLFPFLGYLLSDMTYNPLSSVELFTLSPTPEQLSPLAWRYAVYIVSFAIVYVIARGWTPIRQATFHPPNTATITAFIVLVAVTSSLIYVLKMFYGVDFAAGYDAIYDVFGAYDQMPLVARQLIPNLLNVHTILKMGLVIILVANWHKSVCRYGLVIFLCLSVITYTLRMGSRTELAALLVTAALIYHRLVRPIRLVVAIFASATFLAVFVIVLGMMRGGTDLQTNIEQLRYFASFDVSPLSIANEFQILFGCTYDLYQMKTNGVIQSVPWQLRAYDLLLLVPQQLLPFEKINPTYWYWSFSETKGFFSFNPIAQSVLGLDWLELVVRGAALGWLFAKIHRWYVYCPATFWRTFIYLFLIVWSFYSIKSSTFLFVYFLLYRFLPVMVLVQLFGKLRLTGRDEVAYREVHG
jgi:hypothetical protein